MNGRIIKKDSVSIFLVFPQAFPVIADNYDGGVFVPALLLQIGEKMPKGGIRVGDLAVVKTVFVGLRIWSGRFVGIVRIVKMNPNEARTCTVRVQPILGMLHHVHAAPLYPAPAGL